MAGLPPHTFMNQNFSKTYSEILGQINAIDIFEYAKTRNHVSGAVTYLSPYISRGIISTRMVFEILVKKAYYFSEYESVFKELAWRDYFQRVAQHKDINTDIKSLQTPIDNVLIPEAIVTANTGIVGIDNAIETLYDTGYMHNHSRMYVASLACNICNSHWIVPA